MNWKHVLTRTGRRTTWLASFKKRADRTRWSWTSSRIYPTCSTANPGSFAHQTKLDGTTSAIVGPTGCYFRLLYQVTNRFKRSSWFHPVGERISKVGVSTKLWQNYFIPLRSFTKTPLMDGKSVVNSTLTCVFVCFLLT